MASRKINRHGPHRRRSRAPHLMQQDICHRSKHTNLAASGTKEHRCDHEQYCNLAFLIEVIAKGAKSVETEGNTATHCPTRNNKHEQLAQAEVSSVFHAGTKNKRKQTATLVGTETKTVQPKIRITNISNSTTNNKSTYTSGDELELVKVRYTMD